MRKMNPLIGAGVLALGGLWSLSPPVAQAHDCCQGRHGCLMAAAPDVRPGGGGPGLAPAYDPDTVATLRGTASAVTVTPARGGRTGGVHITLQSDGQTMDVHLGPTWFLEREGVAVAKGDAVEVTGSVIDSDGNSFLIAQELRKGQKVLKLRDERGIPVWAGGRRP
jgi:hypothetical protein